MNVEFQVFGWTIFSISIILLLAWGCISLMKKKMAIIQEAKDRMDIADKIFYIIYEVSHYGFCTWEFCAEHDYKKIDWDTRLDSLDIDREGLSEIVHEIEDIFKIIIMDSTEPECWITAGEIVNYVKARLNQKLT
jgi:hypothetical protein